jgi:hypothetical protein
LCLAILQNQPQGAPSKDGPFSAMLLYSSGDGEVCNKSAGLSVIKRFAERIATASKDVGPKVRWELPSRAASSGC